MAGAAAGDDDTVASIIDADAEADEVGAFRRLPADKQNTGRPNLGGSLATAGGLVFIGATDDKQFAVSPKGNAPVPLHSGVALFGSGPMSPACLALWSAGLWQTVQSTFVRSAVFVWQLVHWMVPATWTAGEPVAWTCPGAMGNLRVWSTAPFPIPSGWQP